MPITYGIISDAHAVDPRAFGHAIQELHKEEADILILNGDISGERTPLKPHEYMGIALQFAGQSGMPTYVNPGSHEEVALFEPLLAHYTAQYPNIRNAARTPLVQTSDHDIFFLPGCDLPAAHIGPNGYLWTDADVSKVTNGARINLNKIRDAIKNPEKTLFVSHVPRKTETLENGVDFADFYLLMQNKEIDGQVWPRGTLIPAVVDIQPYLDKGLAFERRQQNSGNTYLGSIMDELGLNKAVSGHFHESAGRAHDAEGNKTDDERFTDSLYCNASHLDRGIVGLVTIDGARAVYEPIDLSKRTD